MKKKIALVTGGYSGEAVISYKSAATIYNNLDKSLYDVYKIDITTESWNYIDEEGHASPVDKNDFTINHKGKQIKFDAVFIGMHGTPGEDGKLQGYFDMLHLPYTACNAATAAITFNKRYTVAAAAMAGIGVAPSFHIFKGNVPELSMITSSLKLPYFVKPNNGGSSIGMSKIAEKNQLPEAIEKAFKEDTQVLIEQMIEGREFTVGVYKSKGIIHVLPITEVQAHKEFFDFEAKYQGKSTETTPAVIPDSWKEKLENDAKRIYQLFNCRGVIRIDFIYNEVEDKPYMLEVNTIPGQSDASVIPQQVRAAGLKLTGFYSLLVEEAFV